jgi:RNA polymerase sigma-70 factor (ECF subfamily)
VQTRRAQGAPGTLADVLYAGELQTVVPEEEWVSLVRAVAGGDQLALRELYERTNRIVFTLALRLTANPATAEEVTVDVFHEVWRRATGFDPAAGTVVGWIMNQTRSRAIDRLRHDGRKKRVHRGSEDPMPSAAAKGPEEALDTKEATERLRDAMSRLSEVELQAIEVSFFDELTYADTASRLEQPVGTIKTRIRSGLSKLRRVLVRE